MAKTFMGVVHLGALPSASGASAGFEAVLARALADAKALASGGVDAVLVENFGDVPFHKGTAADPVPPDVPAALAVVAREVRVATGLPVGVNCLRNDAVAALGAAAIAGASFVRVNVLSGAAVTDQGLIEGEAARIAAYRRRVGCGALLLADLLVKHAVPLGPIDPVVAAMDLVGRSGADGLILSGDRTGDPVDVEFLVTIKRAVGAFPVWIGSGLNEDNAPSLWPACDGAIVGTSLKRGGAVREPVDAARVARLRAVLDGV